MASSATWNEISEEEARKHPLYGIGGWLLLFAIGMLLAPIKSLGDASSMARAAGMTLNEMFELAIPVVRCYKISLAAQVLQTAVVLWMMLAKPAAFRPVTSWILILVFPTTAAAQLVLAPFEGSAAMVGEMAMLWALSCAIWVTYLNLSRRVRVTFEHRIRGDGATNAVILASATAPVGDRRDVQPTQMPGSAHAHASASFAASDTTADENHWAQALAEFDGSERRPGLWARSFVQAQGDEVKAKVFYIAARADELARSTGEPADHAGPAHVDAPATAAATSITPPQKATCPNCSRPLMLADEECPHCRAFFGPGATWAPIPLAAN